MMRTKIYTTILAAIFSISVSAQVNLAGNTLDHDGTTSVNFGNSDLGLTNEMTIMYWVKWSIDPKTGNKWANMIAINSVNNANSGQFWLQHNSNNSKFEFSLSTLGSNNQMSRTTMFSSTSPEEGIWYHIAAVYDGSKMYLYVNGTLENTQHKSGNIYTLQSDYAMTIASWASQDNNYRALAGQMDEVSIWNKALDADQINSIMNNLLTGKENGLVAYYRFDETEGTTVNDLTGHGYDGTNTSLNGGRGATVVTSTAPVFGMLPIELLYFDAQADNSEVVINWASASEKNNDYYTIYRSVDGINWESIGTTAGAGNSTNVLKYSFTDANPVSGQSYYKLRQTDFDGKFEEFEIVSISIERMASEVSLYPNPAQDIINISYFFDKGYENIEVNIYNAAGQLLTSKNIKNNTFTSETSVDLNDFANGVYFAQINSNNQNLYKSTFIVKK